MPGLTPQRTKHLRGLAAGGAWFFIAVSLVHVLAAAVYKMAEPSGTFKMYHTVVGGVSYDAWGMTYPGAFGLLLAIGQSLVVAAAVVASVLPASMLKWRRIGHGLLIGWAGLWTANFLWLFSVDHELVSFAQAAMTSVLFACTVARAAAGWMPGRATMTPDDPAGGNRAFGDAPPGFLEPPAGQASVPPGRNGHSFAAAIGPARCWVASRVKRCVPAARRGAARGLSCVADFARSQASRLSPTSAR